MDAERQVKARSHAVTRRATPLPDAGPAARAEPLGSSYQHLLLEVAWVELAVRQQLAKIPRTTGDTEQWKGLVISEAEVTELLERPHGSPPFAARPGNRAAETSTDAAAEFRSGLLLRRQETLKQGTELRLVTLQRRFGLSELDLRCLVVCVAPEVDPRFERLFAYLQDDVTRKAPSVELVLNLVCSSLDEKLATRERFVPGAPLIRHRLLRIIEDGARGPETLLARALRVEERITRYLLGSDEITPNLAGMATLTESKCTMEQLVLPAEMKSKLLAIIGPAASSKPAPLMHLRGSYGCGRHSTAEAVCRQLGRKILHFDVARLPAPQDLSPVIAFALLAREARLLAAAIYVDHFDLLLTEDKASLRGSLLRELAGCPGPVFLAGESVWHLSDQQVEAEVISVEFARPDFAARVELWGKELAHSRLTATAEIDIAALSNKFRLTGGQIRDAVRAAGQVARWRDPHSGVPTQQDLNEGCRVHSSSKLATLGRKVRTHQTWADIVLPEDRVRHLQEICDCMKYRSLVFDTWGFDRKLSLGKGLNMLFSGPSGTGKTMAAGIMAAEVDLDVYKIDLSSVVSKYIGETEKNLARIFAEAETSNAILFFDEADALFGKRTEVRDSHDRYANIEINYLLQKMEEHEGVVVLATNFRKNMDDAFVRRLHFTVDFPLPCEADRRRIWEQIWPKDTPRGADLDLAYMARRFELPGGNIRNVALAAAFLAASNGGVVNMSHLLHGTRREYQKMGKVISPGEFE